MLARRGLLELGQWYTAQDAVKKPLSKASRCLRALSLWTLLGMAAWAATASADDDSDEAEYQQLIADALNEYDRGSWEESAALFQRAHELRPSARTWRGLGLAVFEARQYPESITYLSAALTDTRRPLTPKQREEVQGILTRARMFVGYMKLAVEPPDAQVLVNGREAHPAQNGEAITNLGWLDLEVHAEGYEPETRRVRMNAGEHQVFHVRLTPHDDASAGPHAETTDPVATSASRGEPLAWTLPPTAASRPPASPFAVWKWVAAGTAVVALGAGASMLVLQKSGAPAYTAECVKVITPASDCESRRQRLGSTLWTGSILGLSVGGALAAASVVLFALDAKPARSEHAWLRSCRGEGTLGVACRWAF